jgi:hypothetical protein
MFRGANHEHEPGTQNHDTNEEPRTWNQAPGTWKSVEETDGEEGQEEGGREVHGGREVRGGGTEKSHSHESFDDNEEEQRH